jgi:hypothetical protein
MIVPPRTAKIIMRINKRPGSFGLLDMWFSPLRLFSYIQNEQNESVKGLPTPSCHTRPFKNPGSCDLRETAEVGDMARILQKRFAEKCMLYDRTNMVGEKKDKQRVKNYPLLARWFMRRYPTATVMD